MHLKITLNNITGKFLNSTSCVCVSVHRVSFVCVILSEDFCGQ